MPSEDRKWGCFIDPFMTVDAAEPGSRFLLGSNFMTLPGVLLCMLSPPSSEFPRKSFGAW